MQYSNVMVDLETYGQRAGCPILSIGAVAFDKGLNELGPEFYQVIKMSSCEEVGLQADQSTIDWWNTQSKDARKVVDQALGNKRGTKMLQVSLIAFNKYLEQFGSNVKVWGNGSDFDNAIMAYAYHKCMVEPYWKFWNNRCYRTLKGIVSGPKAERLGTYHNALDDAKTQAAHAIILLRGM